MREKEVRKRAAAFLNQAAPVKPEIVDPSRFQLQSKRSYFRIIIFTFTALVLVSTAIGAYSYMTAPRGKITSPIKGAKITRLALIEGFTKNIPPELRYIWLTVDIPARGLSWPKRPIYKPNGTFKTTIHEKGPNKEFTVSLYAVDKACNDAILHWIEISQKSETEPGLDIMPKEFRLDSVILNL